jgi:hypothetical protein
VASATVAADEADDEDERTHILQGFTSA